MIFLLHATKSWSARHREGYSRVPRGIWQKKRYLFSHEQFQKTLCDPFDCATETQHLQLEPCRGKEDACARIAGRWHIITLHARQKRYPPVSTQVDHFDARRLDQTLTTNHAKGWRSVHDAVLLDHRRAHWWVPARTPTVHQCSQSGEAVGDPSAPQEDLKHEVFRQAW